MVESEPRFSDAAARQFPLTHWSLVLAAVASSSPVAAEALEAICQAYWYPLYAYARRCGQTPPDAQDLTQEFFQHLLAHRWLAAADRGKGRLRTFLITAFKHFMAKEWRRQTAGKRGGGQVHLPMDTTFAESRLAAEPTSPLPAEAAFDRQWALTLLELTLQQLEAEYGSAGKAAEFGFLKGTLVAAHRKLDYAALAAQLTCSEGAARVAVHRLRRRFRELYREQIARTLPAAADVEAELRHLANALAGTLATT